MIYEEFEECIHTSFKHQKRPRKCKKGKNNKSSRRRQRAMALAKRRARTMKYRANQEEYYLAEVAMKSVKEDYKTWLVEWMQRPRPLDKRQCFAKASCPGIVFEKQCAAFCGDDNCDSLKNLGCGHWMHPECFERLMSTMNHDGKAVSEASCPLCKYSLEHLRTDSHYHKIEMACEELFQAELLAALQASLAMNPKPSFSEQNLPKAFKTTRVTFIFADDFEKLRLKVASGVSLHVTEYHRSGTKVFGKTPGGWALIWDEEDETFC